jgi:amidophosphoribosyltransferase
MPSRSELVAFNRDTKAIAEAIGADLVIFQTLSDLIAAVQQFNPEIKTFECSVFNGEYVTGGVDERYLGNLESLRADNVKNKVHPGGIGTMEGKDADGVGSNGVDGHINGIEERKEAGLGCSGPMNGADDTVGLYNSWTGAR